jgi:hypothetical protein
LDAIMRHLPAIVSGPGRWVLPMADRSAVFLAECLLAENRAELSGTLADVLAGDPPLLLWAVVAAVSGCPETGTGTLRLVRGRDPTNIVREPVPVSGQSVTRDRFRPSSVADVARWLVEHVLAVLQWPQELPGSFPSADTESRRFTELVGESLCLGELAGELASRTSAADHEPAILAGLLHNAPAWFARSAVQGDATVPERLSEWLSGRSGDAAKSVALAAAILAGDRSVPDLDMEAVRRRAEQAAQAWAASLPGASDHLPALAARLARLEQLDTRFRETLEWEKLEAMAELAAGAGHEINNPLAIIAGRAQLFLQDETDPERRREAAIIVAQVKRAHEMIADMRLFARPPQPEPQSFDLVCLVDGLLGELAPQAVERATSMVRTGHPGPLTVELDPAQVSVALHALVRNALEAIGHGGRIEVGLDGDDASATIRVADNGPGIAAEHRRHIFDPFFSARQAGRGLGMGLSKCWRIVTNHGGHIEVESQPGKGAVFTVQWPRRYRPIEIGIAEP